MTNPTVAQLIAEIKSIAIEIPAGLSRMRKAQLEDLLASMRHEQAHAEKQDEDHDERLGASVAQVLAGPAETTYTEMAAGIDAAVEQLVANRQREEERNQAAAARAVGEVAWRNVTATVRSMGRLVRGKVVDTVLRTPGPDGTGRVCLVVQHAGHPHRRTLHAMGDVALTS